MYSKSAPYYDAIYSFKNYEKESEKIDQIVRQFKKSVGNSLLDVGCGTGGHITFLKRTFSVEGLDISSKLLDQARAKHPEVSFHRGDMSTFRLGKEYDVVTCLFSAIGHVKTKARMSKAVATMAKHLKQGGVLIIEPWFSPDQWTDGYLAANFVDQRDLKIARLSISKRKKGLSINDEHHLVGSPRGIKYFVERLELGLFTPENYVDAFENAGLQVSHDKDGLMGRGLYIGIKPLD